MTDLPRRMAETMDVVSALPRALGPLGQMADLAGGFPGAWSFGGPAARAWRAGRTPRRRGRVVEE